MPIEKTGEIKVYKNGKEVGPKFASEDESNRFTVDDLVRESEKTSSDLILPTQKTGVDEKEDVPS